jgi:hypothetical protein
MKSLIAAACLLAAPAFAQPAPPARPGDPVAMALGAELNSCMDGKIGAIAKLFQAQQTIADLQKQVAALTPKPADPKPPDAKPADPKPADPGTGH